jgi:hypothetical protein
MTTTAHRAAFIAPSRPESDRSTVSPRRAGVVAGAFMLLGTATYATGSALIQSVAASPEGAAAVAERSRVSIGVLLLLVNNAAVVVIGVALFRILQRRHHVVAVTYLTARVIESTLMTVGAIAPLLLVTIGSGTSGSEPEPTMAQMLLDFRDISFQFAMIGLGIGSLALTYTLYTRRLTPRTIAGVGLVGYAFLVAWGALSVLEGGNASMALFAPGAVFEIAFPAWIFARGFIETA